MGGRTEQASCRGKHSFTRAVLSGAPGRWGQTSPSARDDHLRGLASIFGPETFHDCVHSGLPCSVENSPTITNERLPSDVIRPASENTPFMPSIIVEPALLFTETLPFFCGTPVITGVRSMSTVT